MLSRLLTGALLLASLAGGAFAASTSPIPPSPAYHVLDEPHALTPGVLRGLQEVLAEHERVTGEQVVVALFNTLNDQDLVDFTNRIYSAWGIGQRGKNNGALMALYWKEHKSRIEVGYGLEELLTDAKSKMILSDILGPELQAGNADRALSLSTLEILRVIGSPLVENGRAQAILRSGGMHGSWEPVESHGSSNVSLVIGLLFLIGVIYVISSAEAHYTGEGWYKPRPWQRRSRFPGGFGGWGGGMGGGGGFGGRGGSSGGGGASGSW